MQKKLRGNQLDNTDWDGIIRERDPDLLQKLIWGIKRNVHENINFVHVCSYVKITSAQTYY